MCSPFLTGPPHTLVPSQSWAEEGPSSWDPLQSCHSLIFNPEAYSYDSWFPLTDWTGSQAQWLGPGFYLLSDHNVPVKVRPSLLKPLDLMAQHGYTFLTGSQTARAQAFEYKGTLQPSQGKIKSAPRVVSLGPLKVINILGHFVPNSLLWTMSKRQHVAQISTRWKGQWGKMEGTVRHSPPRKQKETGHVRLCFIGQRIDSSC